MMSLIYYLQELSTRVIPPNDFVKFLNFGCHSRVSATKKNGKGKNHLGEKAKPRENGREKREEN